MAAQYSLLAALWMATAAAATTSFLVGSGGCDVLDAGCVDRPRSERLVGAVDVSATGALAWRDHYRPVDAGGVASWLVTDTECAWAALHDTDAVAAFARANGSLALRATVASGGRTPLYLALAGPNWLLAADYAAPDDGTNSSGAGVSLFRRTRGCGLERVSTLGVDAPSHVDPDGRQGASHIHSVIASARFPGVAFACDLGGDAVLALTYRSGALAVVHEATAAPGSGPRHAVEHPTADVVYVLSEMGSSLATWIVTEDDDGAVAMAAGPVVSLLPDGVAPSNASKASEVLATSDGRFLVATVRGAAHALVAIDVSRPTAPKVVHRRVADVDTFPRGAAFVSDGLLLVAGQAGSTLATFALDFGGKISHVATLAGAAPPFPAALAPFAL